MAPYSPQSQHTDRQPGPGFNGRAGYNSNVRGNGEFLSTVREAVKARRAKQDAAEEMRKQVTANLLQSYRQEAVCETHITNNLEHASHTLTESLDSKDKEVLQRKAIKPIQVATECLHSAAKYRSRVEAGWKGMHDLDQKDLGTLDILVTTTLMAMAESARMFPMFLDNNFTNINTDRAKKNAEPQANYKESSKEADDTLNATSCTSERQSKAETELFKCAEEITQKSIFERRPEKFRQKIVGVLESMEVTEGQVGLKESEEAATIDELTSTTHEKLRGGADKKTESIAVVKGLTPTIDHAVDTIKEKIKKEEPTDHATYEQHGAKDSISPQTIQQAAANDQTGDKAAEQG